MTRTPQHSDVLPTHSGDTGMVGVRSGGVREYAIFGAEDEAMDKDKKFRNKVLEVPPRPDQNPHKRAADRQKTVAANSPSQISAVYSNYLRKITSHRRPPHQKPLTRVKEDRQCNAAPSIP